MAKTANLPGVPDARDKQLIGMIQEYLPIMKRRMKLVATEVELKDAILEYMKAKKIHKYIDEEESLSIEIVATKEKLKIKSLDGDDEEEAA